MIQTLSISRPWSELILAGHKPVENRTWNTRHRGLLLLHAAKSWQGAAVDFAEQQGVTGLSWQEADYPTGIVGAAQLVGVCTAPATCQCGPWAAWGQHHWQLAHVQRFPNPIPCNGTLGLWQPGPDVWALVAPQLATP